MLCNVHTGIPYYRHTQHTHSQATICISPYYQSTNPTPLIIFHITLSISMFKSYGYLGVSRSFDFGRFSERNSILISYLIFPEWYGSYSRKCNLKCSSMDSPIPPYNNKLLKHTHTHLISKLERQERLHRNHKILLFLHPPRIHNGQTLDILEHLPIDYNSCGFLKHVDFEVCEGCVAEEGFEWVGDVGLVLAEGGLVGELLLEDFGVGLGEEGQLQVVVVGVADIPQEVLIRQMHNLQIVYFHRPLLNPPTHLPTHLHLTDLPLHITHKILQMPLRTLNLLHIQLHKIHILILFLQFAVHFGVGRHPHQNILAEVYYLWGFADEGELEGCSEDVDVEEAGGLAEVHLEGAALKVVGEGVGGLLLGGEGGEEAGLAEGVVDETGVPDVAVCQVDGQAQLVLLWRQQEDLELGELFWVLEVDLAHCLDQSTEFAVGALEDYSEALFVIGKLIPFLEEFVLEVSWAFSGEYVKLNTGNLKVWELKVLVLLILRH